MKRNTINIVLFLLIISFNVHAQKPKKTFVNDSIYKDISQFTTNDFINMDLNFLGFLPTIEEYKNPVAQFKKGNSNTFRYIDSLDIQRPFKDSLYVKIYTQNYAYSSQNTYSIEKNKIKKEDTLMVYNIKIDQKIKSNISDAETFRKSNFELDIYDKTITNKVPTVRIIFKKNTL